MASVHEQLTEQFRTWEIRGRGWRVFDDPVYPEPPFRPFYGHFLPSATVIDDGRRPTFLSSLVGKLGQKLSGPTKSPPVSEEQLEPEPDPLIREDLVELQTSLPAKLDISKEVFEQFLRNLSMCREPIAFELVGVPGRVSVQFAAERNDAPLVRRQLQTFFPEAVFQTFEDTLQSSWESCESTEALVVEFGLEREFVLPLLNGKLDSLIGLIGTLAELQVGDIGLFQVIFEPAREAWSESIVRSVTSDDGKPFFVNAPELTSAGENKVRSPLYAAVVRIAVKSPTYERAIEIARDLAGSLRVFAHPQGNKLIPLSNDEYPPDNHVEDMLRRQSRRSGMLLNSDELIGFVHFPSSAVRSQALRRDTEKTKAAPGVVRSTSGIILGTNLHLGASTTVRLSAEQRVQHTHIIGASGTGKSTLLFNLIRQSIENGEGVGVLDPHGDLVETILGIIPQERVKDVIFLDPSDPEYSIGFNFLSAHSDFEKNLLASDLVSVFERLSTSWGDQMGSVLRNAVLTFLESTRGGTLVDLRGFLIEKDFRVDFLETVEDPELVYYWNTAFPQLTGNKSIGPILTRIETFLGPKPIRYMVANPENRLNFAEMMDSGKIFLAKLSQGMLGKENSYLLGSLIVSKFHQLAMARQNQDIGRRKSFSLVIDEFSNFITPTMAELLSGSRKYKVGLVLAHQDLRQLQQNPEVASAVMSNAYTRVVFRVGDDDARRLADGFSLFDGQDLQSLDTGKAIVKVERRDFDFNLTVERVAPEDDSATRIRREEVIKASRERYATSRQTIENRLKQTAKTAQTAPQIVSPPVVPDLPVKEEKHEEVEQVPPPPLPTPLEKPKTKSIPGKRPAPARELGRGGVQHQSIQKRIKEAAEARGFLGIIEKPTADGQGSIDLVLRRESMELACEISITTTIDHEVGNVAKCLRAGFKRVIVISIGAERLEQLRAAVLGSLGESAASLVKYHEPNAFIAYLNALPLPSPEPELPQVRRGYKVKRTSLTLTDEERKQKEGAAIRSIAELMKRKI